MVRFYAYYSYGGFKDMLVGGTAVEAPRTFYLPLVENGDDTAPAKAGAPRITVFTDSNYDDYPGSLSRLISNGGYELYYSGLQADGLCSLAVRDIQGNDRDDNGRSIPFVFAFVGEAEDAGLLARAAAQLLMQPAESRRRMAAWFAYDAAMNGLAFDNADAKAWLAAQQSAPATVETADCGQLTLGSESSLLVTTVSGAGASAALVSRLGIPSWNLMTEASNRILPADNATLAQTRRNEWEIERKSRRNALIVKYGLYAAGAVAVFCLLLLITKGCD